MRVALKIGLRLQEGLEVIHTHHFSFVRYQLEGDRMTIVCHELDHIGDEKFLHLPWLTVDHLVDPVRPGGQQVEIVHEMSPICSIDAGIAYLQALLSLRGIVLPVLPLGDPRHAVVIDFENPVLPLAGEV